MGRGEGEGEVEVEGRENTRCYNLCGGARGTLGTNTKVVYGTRIKIIYSHRSSVSIGNKEV